MATDTATDPRVAAVTLALTWFLRDHPDTTRELGIDERGLVDGAPINTPAASRGIHRAIAAAGSRAGR